MMRFDNLIGYGPNRVPPLSVVTSAIFSREMISVLVMGTYTERHCSVLHRGRHRREHLFLTDGGCVGSNHCHENVVDPKQVVVLPLFAFLMSLLI